MVGRAETFWCILAVLYARSVQGLSGSGTREYPTARLLKLPGYLYLPTTWYSSGSRARSSPHRQEHEVNCSSSSVLVCPQAGIISIVAMAVLGWAKVLLLRVVICLRYGLCLVLRVTTTLLVTGYYQKCFLAVHRKRTFEPAKTGLKPENVGLKPENSGLKPTKTGILLSAGTKRVHNLLGCLLGASGPSSSCSTSRWTP